MFDPHGMPGAVGQSVDCYSVLWSLDPDDIRGNFQHGEKEGGGVRDLCSLLSWKGKKGVRGWREGGREGGAEPRFSTEKATVLYVLFTEIQ